MIELLAALKRRQRAIEEKNLDALLEAHHTVLLAAVTVSTDVIKHAIAELRAEELGLC